jgi:hypothetical protein
MHPNLSDGSGESHGQAQLDVRDNISRSWTYGDIVVHKHQARESTSPGLGRRKRNLRNELRGPEMREAIMAGVVIALFLAGVVTGIFAVVAVAVRREDRAYTLGGDAPSRMSKSARRLNGLGRRDLDAEYLRAASELVH